MIAWEIIALSFSLLPLVRNTIPWIYIIGYSSTT
jgi:hypothetical protein